MFSFRAGQTEPNTTESNRTETSRNEPNRTEPNASYRIDPDRTKATRIILRTVVRPLYSGTGAWVKNRTNRTESNRTESIRTEPRLPVSYFERLCVHPTAEKARGSKPNRTESNGIDSTRTDSNQIHHTEPIQTEPRLLVSYSERLPVRTTTEKDMRVVKKTLPVTTKKGEKRKETLSLPSEKQKSMLVRNRNIRQK